LLARRGGGGGGMNSGATGGGGSSCSTRKARNSGGVGVGTLAGGAGGGSGGGAGTGAGGDTFTATRGPVVVAACAFAGVETCGFTVGIVAVGTERGADAAAGCAGAGGGTLAITVATRGDCAGGAATTFGADTTVGDFAAMVGPGCCTSGVATARGADAGGDTLATTVATRGICGVAGGVATGASAFAVATLGADTTVGAFAAMVGPG